ncbi:hypothetical protein ACEWY4_025659 [Coilia grayii]|uniref:Peptidase S1 domain-containing protein n=1 Tax=Coilia grayii TaxID=363190 RepID=A0ABD1ISW9_9TELE
MAISRCFFLFLITCFSVPGSYSQLNVCGRPAVNRLTTRIVGGQDAPRGSWPWQASLHRYGRHFCAGSLINKEWILSAAHCFPSTNPTGLIVYLGRHAQLITNPNEVSRTVARIILHPQYDYRINNNDIALLRLSSPVPFTDFIKPACLAASNSVFNSGEDSWVTGWGTVREGVRLPFPQTLQEVELPIVGNRQCKCQNGIGWITDNMVCAGLLTGGKDSCQGDSGGPMVNIQNNVWVQSGIVSWGFGCARPELPGVYTRVSRYQEWIRAQVTGESPGFVTFLPSGIDTDSTYTCPGLPLPDISNRDFTTMAPTGVSSANVCGTTPLNPRIVGGQDAPVGSWPWQASFHRFGFHFCGGSLINKEWVMSAAHCFPSTSETGLTVYLGRLTQQSSNPNEVSRCVIKIILHPNYDSKTTDNNIALLRLSSPVQFTDFIRPVCLAASGSVFSNGTDSWVTGWGSIGETDPLPFPQVLQEVEVPVVGNRQCSCLNGIGRVTESMICAGLLTGGKDSCQGDSGGPMMSKQEKKWVQSGIVSWGFGCARPELPGVYSRVSRFQSWISSEIQSDPPGFVKFSTPGTDADSSFTCPGLPPPPATTRSPTPATPPPPAPSSVPTTPASTNSLSADVCGTTPLNPRIVGGQDAPPGSWPWQASLHRFGRHFCGGSLINKEWIISAAHCFLSTNPSGLTVYLGRQSQFTSNPNEVSRSVIEIILHPSFKSLTNNNDIALLRLRSPVQFTNFIRPVCLAASGSVFSNGTDSWVTGWGNIGEGVPLPFPQTLQEVEVPVVGNRQCNCLNGVGRITENMICAGILNGGKDACQGDSGGPMMSKQEKKWILSGIVSWGFGCARPELPGVYSRVSRFQSWISSEIQSDPPGFVKFSTPGTDADSSFTCPGLPPPPATTRSPTPATPPPPAPSSVPTTPASTNSLSADVCGTTPLNPRIVGGQDAPPGSWPWQATLHWFGHHFCGGSLINKEWVISAAHCFLSTNPSELTVYLGRQTQLTSNPNEVSRNVIEIILHPSYESLTNNNDIALLRLRSPVQFTNFIRPVCLAASGSVFSNGTDSWVTGWGSIGEGVPLPFPQTLQEVEVPVVGNRQCNCLNGVGSITENMICAGVLNGGKDTCQGDSGGPMMSKQEKRWVQSGIVSWGFGCARPELPGVYSRVSRFQSWISSEIQSDPPGFVKFSTPGTDADINFTCPGLPPPLPPAPSSVPTTAASINSLSADVCGTTPLNPRIVGGQDAPPGSWPWQASVHGLGRHFCGGSLVNKEWVISAAQCFPSANPIGLTVYLGRQTQFTSNPNEVSRNVIEIISHPSYNSSTRDNDIALLRLSSPVQFTDFIRPVCLAASGSVFSNGTDSWVTGWGSIGEGNFLPFPQTLQEVQVPVVGNRQCSCLNGVGRVTENMICAGLLNGGKDSCQGDSGSPMMNKQEKKWVQSGIVSWGLGCARPERPGVYSRVSRFQSWIRSRIQSDPPGFVMFSKPGPDVDNSVTCPGLPPLPAPSTLPTTAAPTSSLSADVCGRTPLNPRIVGGQDATPGSWPWQASVHRFGRHACGGSLVNKEWVISSARCFLSTNPSGLTVYLGRQTQLTCNPNEVSRSVIEIILHPSYDHFTNDNDIALLRLRSIVQFTDFIRPVCLAASDSVFSKGTDSWVTGWGNIGEGNALPFPQTLQEVEVPVVGNRECSCLNGVGRVTENMICAGLLNGGKDSCQVDSGGPMMSKQDMRWVQSGIVSWGFGCARPQRPGVYSRVSRFQSWIRSQIQSDPPGFITFATPGPDADNIFTCPGLPPPPTTVAPLSTVIPPTVEIRTSPVCGRAPLNTKTKGNGSMVAGRWPWMVSIQRNGVHMCAGSVLTEEFVMTSADCFDSSVNIDKWTVLVGPVPHGNGSDTFMFSHTLANITVSNVTNSSNIAVLQLNSSMELSDYVQSLCIDASNVQAFPVGSTCWVAGWGDRQGNRDLVMTEMDATIMDCGNDSSPGTICTTNMDIRQGDVGSPLMCKLDQSWFQAAIIIEVPQTNITRAQGTLTFSKPSKFSAFLEATVGDLPFPLTAETIGTVDSSNSVADNSAHTFLSFSLLLSLISAFLSLSVMAC